MEKGTTYTDKALFDRIALGDEAAFTDIFFQYIARLSPFITQLLHADTWTEEIVQDVFMSLWQNRAKLADITHPSAYLYQMASNRTLDYIQRNARDIKLQYYIARRQGPDGIADITEADVDFREIDGLLKEAISRLPPQRKKIYQLAREEGLSHAGIAEQLKISKHTVRNHLADALQQIRVYLRERGVMVVVLMSLWNK